MSNGIVEIPSELSGNRNLLSGSSITATELTRLNLTISPELLSFKTVTLSVDVKYINASPASQARVGMEIRVNREDGTYTFLGVWKSLKVGDSYEGRISNTYIIEYKIKSGNVANLYPHLVTGDLVEVGNPKIEFGDIPTPWSPAPEDLGYEIPDWVQNFDNPVQVTPEGIASKNIVEIPSELSGGRNLLTDSKIIGKKEGDVINLSQWGGDTGIATYSKDIPEGFQNGLSYKIEHLTAGTGGIFFDTNNINSLEFKAGEVYTLSFYAKQIGEPSTNYYFSLNRKDNMYFATGAYDVTEEWKYFTKTFTIPEGKEGIYKTRHITYDPSTVWIAFLKIERGDKATPYQPSPEELGYVIPSWVQSFDAPISISSEGIAFKEIVETPDELMSGRNLIKNSESINIGGSDTSSIINRTFSSGVNRIEQKATGRWNNYFFAQHLFTDPDFFKNIGQSYILSADIRTSMSGGQVTFRFDTRTPDTAIYSASNPVENTNGEWVRTSSIMVMPDRAVQSASLLILNGSDMSIGDYVEIKNIKLEKGDTATPYSKAPEDLGYQIPIWAKNFNNPISVSLNGVMVSGK